jgi:hypothetical protein
LLYVNAPSAKVVLTYWYDIRKTIPVDWNNKESIKRFREASDKYAKTWSKLSSEDQGLVCEYISKEIMPM